MCDFIHILKNHLALEKETSGFAMPRKTEKVANGKQNGKEKLYIAIITV